MRLSSKAIMRIFSLTLIAITIKAQQSQPLAKIHIDESGNLEILNLEKLVDQISKFMELKMEIYELKVKEQLVGIISNFATLALIFSLGLFMLLFASLALGFYLNTLLESTFLGFFLVGGLYLLICLTLILFKDKIITNNLLQAFFSDTLTRKENEQDSEEQEQD